MKTYQGSEIRNVAVVGHAHCGKTTMIAALLHAAKMTPTQGRVADGTAHAMTTKKLPARNHAECRRFCRVAGRQNQFRRYSGFHMFSHEAVRPSFPSKLLSF